MHVIARIDRHQRHAAFGEVGQKSVSRCRIGSSPDVQRPKRIEEATAAQPIAGCGGQRLDAGAAIGFGPECGRSPRGVIAGDILRLDQQNARLAADLGRQRCTRHACADDCDIEDHGTRVARN